MTDKLIPNRVIVDRTVLADLIWSAAVWLDHDGTPQSNAALLKLAEEVRSGERVELYAADWPGS